MNKITESNNKAFAAENNNAGNNNNDLDEKGKMLMDGGLGNGGGGGGGNSSSKINKGKIIKGATFDTKTLNTFEKAKMIDLMFENEQSTQKLI